MKRAVAMLFVWTACAMCSGCLVSGLHPVYDDDSIEFDDALVGGWENTELEISAVVSRAEWRSYHIAFTDRFGTTAFTGHLTSVGKARFLNLLPADGLDKPAFVVATNGFVQIDAHANHIRLREPDYAAVLKRLQAGRLGTPAATDVKQNVVLMASSAKLRAWLATALKDETLWAEWKTFTRSAR